MGGMAFKNTTRIKKEDILPTLLVLEHSLEEEGIFFEDLNSDILGSAGKKETSGDIDLNIDSTKFDIDEFASVLIYLYGEENVKYRPGTNQIFTSVDIFTDSSDTDLIIQPEITSERVQVDFMFGNYSWQKFSYFSSPESSYKGLYRTELLKAVTAYMSSFVAMEGSEMVGRIGPTFFHDKGCIWRYRLRPYRKVGDTTKRIQSLKEVSQEQFTEMFPESKDVVLGEVNISSPSEFCSYFFDSTVKPEDLETYEQIRDLILSNPTKFDKKKVFSLYEERLVSLKQPIPDEIRNDFN